MNLFSRISLVFLLMAIIGASAAYSQSGRPRASQRGYIEQTVGSVQIKITYHRPNIKGRKLWGADGLVPTGKVWRAGANEATLFEFTRDVTVNGEPLPAGKYSFYAIPGDKSWTLIFNKSWEQWGTVYDQKSDALRVMVTPVMSGESKESLAYLVEDVTGKTAVVILAWGKARIPFKVSTGSE